MQRRPEKRSWIKNSPAGESILTMLASENVLKKEWGNKADDVWNKIKSIKYQQQRFKLQ
ncbi:hypothetical protein HYY73_04720 [Candidatus Woesearchaeota archaeon]|nr:hypothetical protein [Candidatus Woesearchaeota archaeon]